VIVASVMVGLVGVAAINARIYQNDRQRTADRALFREREQSSFRSGEQGESPKV
jgi:hypothetical protein